MGGKKWESGNGICVRKDDTKILGQKEGSGDETTNDRGLRPIRSSHNTIFTTHAIWFFTTLSGWLDQVFFFLFHGGKSLCITTGTKNENIFSEKERKLLLQRKGFSARHPKEHFFSVWKFLEKTKEEKQKQLMTHENWLWSTTKEKRKKRFKKQSYQNM